MLCHESGFKSVDYQNPCGTWCGDGCGVGRRIPARNQAGVPPDRIVFSGVGKTRAEMEMIVQGGVRQVNVESEPEMVLLDKVARAHGKKIPITIA